MAIIIRIHALKSNVLKRNGVLNPQLRSCEWEIAITMPPVSPALSVGSPFQKVGWLVMVVVIDAIMMMMVVVIDPLVIVKIMIQ